MVFYKMQQGQHEFFFQLANLDVREDFSIWDNVSKRYLRQIEGVNDINDLKFMLKDLFAQRYPNFAKKSQYIREVIINLNGTPTLYSFGFTKTAHDQINEEIRGRMILGKDPLDYTFKYRRTGEKLQTTHVVVVMQEVGKPQGVLNPTTPQSQPQANLSPSSPSKPLEQPKIRLEVASVGLSLTPQEQVIVELFNQDKQIYSEDLFVDVFNNTMVRHYRHLPDVLRVKMIYKEYYLRQLPSKS